MNGIDAAPHEERKSVGVSDERHARAAMSFAYTPPAIQRRNCSLLVGVFSSKVVGRSFVRQTWGADRELDAFGACLWFIVGLAPNATESTRQLHAEQAAHGDLLLIHGHSENYGSLPTKVLSFYRAASQDGPANITHLLKTDDDVYISLPTVRRLLPLLGRRHVYAGYMYGGIAPLRDGKYRDHIYQRRHMVHAAAARGNHTAATTPVKYPPFVDGIAELMSLDVAKCIGERLPSYSIPSTLADVVTGHAALDLCRVHPCAGRTQGCLILPTDAVADWPALPVGEQVLVARHADRSVVLDRYRGRILRFMLQPNK